MVNEKSDEDLNLWKELAYLEDNKLRKVYYKLRSLFWKRIPGDVCQNCIHGNNDKGKWKKTWKRRSIYVNDPEGNYPTKYWHIFCEKKKKYFPWDARKRCIERQEGVIKHIRAIIKAKR